MSRAFLSSSSRTSCSHSLQPMHARTTTIGTRFLSAHAVRALVARGSARSRTVARVSFFDQAWAPSIDAEVRFGTLNLDTESRFSGLVSQSLAPQLFALSLFPYIGFLYHLTRSGKAPRLVLFGFYFLLVFVGATIPAGIYAKVHYDSSLSNVDYLHGSAESMLTLTNLFIVLGLRSAINAARKKTEKPADGEQVPEAEA